MLHLVVLSTRCNMIHDTYNVKKAVANSVPSNHSRNLNAHLKNNIYVTVERCFNDIKNSEHNS